MRFLLAVLALLPSALANLEFTNPPLMKKEGDLSNILSYEMGSLLEVRWTQPPVGQQTSLGLWQLNATTAEFFGSMEYVTRKAVDLSGFNWIVATTKDLTVSNLFFLTIFVEGQGTGDSNTEYFNITKASAVQLTTTAQSSTAVTASTAATSPSRLSTTSSSTAETGTSTAEAGTSTAPTPSGSPSPGGLTVDAKIGLGVAIPCVLGLGALAGYLLFRRRKRRVGPPKPHMYDDAHPYNGMARGQWGGAPPPGKWEGNYGVPMSYGQFPYGNLAAKYHQPVEIGHGEDPRRVFELSAARP